MGIETNYCQKFEILFFGLLLFLYKCRKFQAAAPLLKTPLSQAQQQAYSAAAATYTAVAGMRAAYGAAAAAAAQPVAGYAAVAAG